MTWGSLFNNQHVSTSNVQNAVSVGALEWSGSPVSGLDPNMYWTRNDYTAWIRHSSTQISSSGISGNQHMTKQDMFTYAAFVPDPPVLSLVSSQGSVVLSWQLVPDATSYQIYRSTTNIVLPDSSHLIASNATSPFTDSNVTAGVTYYYWATASSSAGASTFSNRVTATVTAAPPPVNTPQSFTGTGGFFFGQYEVSLSWNNAGVSQQKTLQVYNAFNSEYETLSSTIGTNQTSFTHVFQEFDRSKYGTPGGGFFDSDIAYRIRFNNQAVWAETTVSVPENPF